MPRLSKKIKSHEGPVVDDELTRKQHQNMPSLGLIIGNFKKRSIIIIYDCMWLYDRVTNLPFVITVFWCILSFSW